MTYDQLFGNISSISWQYICSKFIEHVPMYKFDIDNVELLKMQSINFILYELVTKNMDIHEKIVNWLI